MLLAAPEDYTARVMETIPFPAPLLPDAVDWPTESPETYEPSPRERYRVLAHAGEGAEGKPPFRLRGWGQIGGKAFSVSDRQRPKALAARAAAAASKEAPVKMPRFGSYRPEGSCVLGEAFLHAVGRGGGGRLATAVEGNYVHLLVCRHPRRGFFLAAHVACYDKEDKPARIRYQYLAESPGRKDPSQLMQLQGLDEAVMHTEAAGAWQVNCDYLIGLEQPNGSAGALSPHTWPRPEDARLRQNAHLELGWDREGEQLLVAAKTHWVEPDQWTRDVLLAVQPLVTPPPSVEVDF